MAQNPSQYQQQTRSITSHISSVVDEIEELAAISDPKVVRARNKLNKAIFKLKGAGDLVMKFSQSASKQKSSKVENGEGTQYQQSKSSQRWEKEPAMS